MLLTMADNLNIVDRILAKPFESLPYEEKLKIKQQGRSTPKINLVQRAGKRNRSFQLSWYDKVSWLTGSDVTNKMYCWPCKMTCNVLIQISTYVKVKSTGSEMYSKIYLK